MTALDYDDLEKQLHTSGGFSVNHLGHAPKHGIMVSRSGSEHVVPGIAKASDIEAFAGRVSEFVSSGRRARAHIGAWVEDTPEGGKQTVFDVSQQFAPRQREAAMTQAAVHGQRSSYDIDNEDYPKPPIRGGMSDEELHSRGLTDFPYRQTLPLSADAIGDVTAFSPRRAFYTAGRGARGDGVQGELPFSAAQRRQLGMR